MRSYTSVNIAIAVMGVCWMVQTPLFAAVTDSTHTAADNQSHVSVQVSEDRISTKQEAYRTWMATSRWVWRTTQGATAATLLGAAYMIYQTYYGDHHQTAQVSDAGNAQEADAGTHERLHKLNDQVQQLETQVRQLQRHTQIQSHSDASSQHNEGWFSWNTWKPKLRTCGYVMIDTIRQNAYRAILSGIATAPITLYRNCVRPIYASDMASFIATYTNIHQLLVRMKCMAGNAFSQFQDKRTDLTQVLVHDIESILAFLRCAREYVSDNLYKRITWVHDDITMQIDRFLQDVFADEHSHVTAAIDRLQTQLQTETAIYERIISQQDVLDWVTTL